MQTLSEASVRSVEPFLDIGGVGSGVVNSSMVVSSISVESVPVEEGAIGEISWIWLLLGLLTWGEYCG